MTELIIQIPPQKEALVKELIEELGGSIAPANAVASMKKKPGTGKSKKQSKNIDHSFLFGKWKDFDIDARKLREDLWKRD